MGRNALFLLAALSISVGCAAEESDDQGSDASSASGKADDTSDDSECAANIVNPRVVVNTRDSGDGQVSFVQCGGFTDADDDGIGDTYGFVANACCENADGGNLFESLTAVTGCPQQVRVVGEGSFARCSNDTEGDAQGQFVPSTCCAAFCDEASSRDANGMCRDSAGQFEDEICCHPALTADDRRAQDERSPDRAGDLGRDIGEACEWFGFAAQNPAGRSFACTDGSATVPDSCCVAGCAAGRIDRGTCEDATDNLTRDVLAPLQCSDDDQAISRLENFFDSAELTNSEFTPTAGLPSVAALREGTALTEIDLTPEIVAAQLHASLEFLGFGSFESEEELFDFVDEEPDRFQVHLLEVQDIEGGIIQLDWIEFGMGDTEVGVVFEHRSFNEVVAEIGDGDIRVCL